MPVLRYVVLGDGAVASSGGDTRLGLLVPRAGALLAADSTLRVVWSGDRGASFYRLEVARSDGRDVFKAVVPKGVLRYEVPGTLLSQAQGALRWRVSALDGAGKLLRRTSWRSIARP